MIKRAKELVMSIKKIAIFAIQAMSLKAFH
jgi:hypothetical protein